VIGLPRFGTFSGPYTDYLLAHAVSLRRATNVVMAVAFDFRGFDTLGEEFILFTAVSGVALLLRESRRRAEYQRPTDAQPVEALAAVGLALSPAFVVLGLYLVAHGHLTPGGGFQGGVVLAAGALLVYLAGQYRGFRKATPEQLLDVAEGVGAGGYVAVGLSGLALGTTFLVNVLPYGRIGQLDSSGTIAVIDTMVGLEVAAAFVLLVTEFVEEASMARTHRDPDSEQGPDADPDRSAP
jgi:multicomponent Na+:H+ antiporter subunit B